MANAKLYRRNQISWETELEGHLPFPGDKVRVSYDLPSWGVSGEIIGVSGADLTLDRDMDWTGGPFYLWLRQPDGSVDGPHTVTQGGSDDVATLSGGALSWNPRTGLNGERTHFAFGAQADSGSGEDVLILETEPSGENTVRITGVVYDANVYNGLPT